MMAVECGMRFLTDYFNGNRYFKVDYDGHNLVRAKNQLRLAQNMQLKIEEMKKIVRDQLKS